MWDNKALGIGHQVESNGRCLVPFNDARCPIPTAFLRCPVALVHDQAICVRVWDWSETSQTMLLLTRGLGLVRALAKGAKRANSSFSGGVEAMTRGEILVSTRAMEKPGQHLATLASWDLVETFPQTRRSLDAYYAGVVLLDLVQHGLHDADPHPEVFDALVVSLREACDGGREKVCVLRFAWNLLALTGHAPELVADVVSGEVLQSAESYSFLPRRGGFTRDGANSAGEVAWRARDATRQVLIRVAKGERVEQDETTARAMKMMLSYFREVHQCDPAGVRMFLDLPEQGRGVTPTPKA